MGFWNKLGKLALTAAPYVAAPFTGGLSLGATGLANKAVQKWSESDAKKAAAKGLAPSKFDSVLGKVGTISSLASSVIPTSAFGAIGMLGKAGSAAGKAASAAGSAAKAAGTASKLGKVGGTLANIGKGAIGAGGGWQGQIGGILANAATDKLGGRGNSGMTDSGPGGIMGNRGVTYPGIAGGQYSMGDSAEDYSGGLGPSRIPSQSGSRTPSQGPMPRGGFRYSDNPMNQYDQSNPNLATSIFQGRQEAMQNQPFRRGYDVNTTTGYDEEDNPIISTSRMPRITSGKPDQRQQKVSSFGSVRRRAS